jgi:hypothetical protein
VALGKEILNNVATNIHGPDDTVRFKLKDRLKLDDNDDDEVDQSSRVIALS